MLKITLFLLFVLTFSSLYFNVRAEENEEGPLLTPEPDVHIKYPYDEEENHFRRRNAESMSTRTTRIWHETRHECIHDTHIVPMMERERLRDKAMGIVHDTAEDYERQARREGVVQAVGPIRIVARTEDLFNGRYCNYTGQVVDDFQGGTIACGAEHVFTPEKRDFLINKFFPAAAAKIARYISVNQLTTPLKATSTSCGSHTFNASDVSVGVPNADFIISLSAVPTTAVAWAGYCQYSSGRPTRGRMNFSPQYLVYDENDQLAFNSSIGTTIHEIFHALGFTSGICLKNPISVTRRGKPIIERNGTKLLQKAREFYGCSNLSGVEIQDSIARSLGGGDTSGGSHWARRNMIESVMSPIVGVSRIDVMTLAAFEDAGVGYTINYDEAEEIVLGNNKYTGVGCGFLDNRCGLPEAGMGDMCEGSGARRPCPFCGPSQASNTSMCTPDLTAIGSCNYNIDTADVYTYYQNHPSNLKAYGSKSGMNDLVTMISGYSNRKCNFANESTKDSTSNIQRGYTYSDNGRCLRTNGLIQKAYTAPGAEARCIDVRCVNNQRVQIKIRDGNWTDCPLNGGFGVVQANATHNGYKGTIDCPAARDVCTPALLYVQETPAPPVTTTTANNNKNNNNNNNNANVEASSSSGLAGGAAAGLAIGIIVFVVVVVAVVIYFVKYHKNNAEAKENNEPAVPVTNPPEIDDKAQA